MRIYIEAEHTKRQKTGVGYYTYNLIKALQKTDNKNDYTLLFWKILLKKGYSPIEITAPNFKNKFIRFSYHLYYKLFKLGLGIPLNFFAKKPDLALFTNFVLFPVYGGKKVVVIYDLSFKKYPQYSDKKNEIFLNKFVPKAVKKADHIITISQNSKKEIIEFYNASPDKVSIINPSYSKDIFKPQKKDSIEKIKEKYKIGSNYFLFTSSLEPRKNVLGIIKAYVSLPLEIRKENSLVLVGGKGWKDEEIWLEIEKQRKQGNKIITPGYVLEEELPIFYSGANIFLYPSIYEGFGIPILEAMACGAPVITSNISSMPEVAGDAALLVNPEKSEEIKEAIIEIVNNDNLRKDLIDKGFKQIKKFSWEESAKKLLEVFKKN